MDPSMLIAFLIQSRADWERWKESISQIQGKPVLHVADHEPPLGGRGAERAEAIDEVETFDEELPPDDVTTNT
jgi:cysteine protease ATG4